MTRVGRKVEADDVVKMERAVQEIRNIIEDDADQEQEQDHHHHHEDGPNMSYNNKFPGELREEMIGRVSSVTHLFRLRLVCKAWNAIITSPHLAQLHAAHRHDEVPWLLVARSTHIRRPLQAAHYKSTSTEKPLLHLVCDPRTSTMQQWIAPPLPFLATHSCDLSTCQSHNGLVCCLASTKPGAGRSNTVLIFNPITRAYKLLPSPSNGYGGFWWSAARRAGVQQYNAEELQPSTAVDVALWRSSASKGHFRVSVCETVTREVRVFDSRIGYWKQGSRAPDHLKPRFQGFRDSSNPDTLYWYDVEVDTWFQTRLPPPPAPNATLKWPSIFKDGATATLMLAAVLVQRRGGATMGFGIWVHRGGAADGGGGDDGWVQMGRTPAGLLQGVRGAAAVHRLRDSKLMCHPKYVCMTGLLRFSLWPWKCFYPWILSFNGQPRQQQAAWEWSSQPLGPKTWANFHVLSLLDPTLLCIP